MTSCQKEAREGAMIWGRIPTNEGCFKNGVSVGRVAPPPSRGSYGMDARGRTD